MIGTVTPDLKAAIHIVLLNSEGLSSEIEVFVDTGFNGDISLSPEIIVQHQFEFIDEVAVQLADGNMIPVSIYDGHIRWFDQLRHVTVLATNGDAVLGMRLLENYELKIEVHSGGAVTIESLI